MTASVPSLVMLKSFFLIVDSCGWSSSLSDPSSTAKAIKHLQQFLPLSDAQMQCYME
jgi:hypothetical protein